MNDLVVLVSAARHPVTGAPQRHAPDARALELALRVEGASPLALHFGRSDEPALRFYVGMGPRALRVCPADNDVDLLPLVHAWVERARPRAVLTGDVADSDEAQGMLPFALGAALGWPVLSQVCAVESAGDGLRVTCAPRIDRRVEWRVDTPVVLVAGDHGPEPRPFAYGRARRTPVEVAEPAPVALPAAAVAWQRIPARPAARRLRRFDAAASEADKVAALMAAPAGKAGAPRFALDARHGARLLVDYLREHGITKPS
jgi:electron transfer flavoprotein beta subunit